MTTSIHERVLTSSLERHCARLEELSVQVRYLLPRLTPDLLDEIAVTIGELMLVLFDLQSAHPSEEAIRHAVSDARGIREAVRSQKTQHEQIATAVAVLIGEVDQIIREEKQAA